MPDSKRPLDLLQVLVTRPAAQATQLCQLIEAAGGTALRFPVIKIEPLSPTESSTAFIQQADLAIFISTNAVDFGLPLLKSRGQPPIIAAVGQKTRQRLVQQGITDVLTPESDFSSEGLLNHNALQRVKNKKIGIFRGKGGREILAKTLSDRGAVVEHIEVYRRSLSTQAAPPKLAANKPCCVTITSIEALKNFIILCDKALEKSLYDLQLITLSQRIADEATGLGFRKTPLVAPEASDKGLVQALISWQDRAIH